MPESELTDQKLTEFRSAHGSLQWIANQTRPDLASAVSPMTQQAEHQERINLCIWTREDTDVQHFATTKFGGPVGSQVTRLMAQDLKTGNFIKDVEVSDTPEAQLLTELPTGVVGLRTTLWYTAKKTANWKLKLSRVDLMTGVLIAFTDALWGNTYSATPNAVEQRGYEVAQRIPGRLVSENKEDAPPYLTTSRKEENEWLQRHKDVIKQWMLLFTSV
eukprot:774043-Amphidinium_carterae.2